MSESESRLLGTKYPPDPEAKSDTKPEKRWHELYQDLHLPVDQKITPTVKRTSRRWEPTEREQVILRLPAPGTKGRPGQMRMDAYCQALDAAHLSFPKRWQKNGHPKTHSEAWDSKNKRLRQNLMNERHNAWRRFRESF